RARNGYFVRVWKRVSCGFETDGVNERVEVVDDALIEPVEERSALAAQLGVGRDWGKKAGSQRSVDAFKELQKDEADRVAVGEDPIAARVWQLLDEALGAQI